MKTTLIAAAALSLLGAGVAQAQTTTTTVPVTTYPAASAGRPASAATMTTAPMHGVSRAMPRARDRAAEFKNEKDQLEQKLQAATGRADYAKILQQNGWRISSINADKPDYLEYEIVKGDHSYEVQLDFKDNAPKASKVDVTTNLWRTDATKRMLADNNYKPSGPLVADPEGRYSDRRYMKASNDEKEKLDKALKPTMKVADLKSKIEQMGYQITSVNDSDKDYVEYEIVKGENSYEVQADLDPQTGMTKNVDVDANVWETDATERAKGEKGAGRQSMGTMATAPAAMMASGASPTRPITTGLMTSGPMSAQRHARAAEFKNEKDQLETKLQAATGRADYAKILQQNGWRISSINADKPDYLEYEIVKGDHSYEVQLDFKDNAPKASKVDVTTNLWRTDATKRMLADNNYKPSGPLVADPEGRYSDRRYMKGWTDEKDQLEKALSGSMKDAAVKSKLEQMGYKITSVNDKDADYAEYEIVKGDHSYEVQVDLDPKTRMTKNVDVTSNLWEADSTERAKGEKAMAPAK